MGKTAGTRAARKAKRQRRDVRRDVHRSLHPTAPPLSPYAFPVLAEVDVDRDNLPCHGCPGEHWTAYARLWLDGEDHGVQAACADTVHELYRLVTDELLPRAADELGTGIPAVWTLDGDPGAWARLAHDVGLDA